MPQDASEGRRTTATGPWVHHSYRVYLELLDLSTVKLSTEIYSNPISEWPHALLHSKPTRALWPRLGEWMVRRAGTHRVFELTAAAQERERQIESG